MARERYNWLDIMKLIAIWLMDTTHYDGMGRFGILGLYSVLGILFFSSGFTAFTRKDSPLLQFIKGKFISIMVPYFAFCFLTLAIRAFMLEMSMGEMIAWTRGILSGVRNQVPLAAMWFLPCLFCMEIYYHVLTRLLKNRWLVLAVCAAISFWVKMVHEGPEYLWGVEVAGRYLIYYALGDVFSHFWRSRQGRPFGLAAKGVFAVVAAFSFYILYVNFYFGLTYFPSLAGMEEAPYWMLSLLTFLYQCSAVVCAMVLGFAFQQVPLLCAMGRMTLVLCGTEQIVKVLVPMAFEAIGLTIPAGGGAMMVLQAFGMMLVAYFCFAKPIQKYFPWMLGKFSKPVKPQ